LQPKTPQSPKVIAPLLQVPIVWPSGMQTVAVPWAGHSENTQRAPRLSFTQFAPNWPQLPKLTAPSVQLPIVDWSWQNAAVPCAGQA